MAGYPYPVRVPASIPPEARRAFKIAVAVFAVEVVVVGVILGILLPPNVLWFATVFIVEWAFVIIWFLVLRYVLKKRFGVALPLIRRY